MWYVDPPLHNLPEQPPHPNFGIVAILSNRTFTLKRFIHRANNWTRANTEGKTIYVVCMMLAGIGPIIGGLHLLLKNLDSDLDDTMGAVLLLFGLYMTFGFYILVTNGEDGDKV